MKVWELNVGPLLLVSHLPSPNFLVFVEDVACLFKCALLQGKHCGLLGRMCVL